MLSLAGLELGLEPPPGTPAPLVVRQGTPGQIRDTSTSTPEVKQNSREAPAGPSNKEVYQPIRTTGLKRVPLSGGVKNATMRYDLPPPPVAVRNLVSEVNHMRQRVVGNA
jgi:hypothetical protein